MPANTHDPAAGRVPEDSLRRSPGLMAKSQIKQTQLKGDLASPQSSSKYQAVEDQLTQ
jgi:hypothetical protein